MRHQCGQADPRLLYGRNQHARRALGLAQVRSPAQCNTTGGDVVRIRSYGISPRLRRLPGQFLLALINATTILVIVAAVLALIAMGRITNFAENIVAKMTEAVLSKLICRQGMSWQISEI